MAETSKQAGAKPTGWVRDWLGLTVFGVSALSILILAVSLVWSADQFDQKEKVFNALLPLFGTWVGTILAFYFSRENFESARQSLENVVERLTPEERLQQTAVTQAMIPLAQIRGISLSPGNDDSSVQLQVLLDTVQQGYTRVPVFNSDKSGRYIIHQSILFKFIAYGQIDESTFSVASKTLEDMLKVSDIGEAIKTIAWVRRDSTLADAKDTMEQLKGCQDAFVTETGKPTEPVLGWVTNIDIQRHSRA